MYLRFLLNITIIGLYLILGSCAETSSNKKFQPNDKQSQNSVEQPTNNQIINNGTTNSISTNQSTATETAGLKVRPIIFFAGYGWDMPGNEQQPFLDRFSQDGFPKEHLYFVTYDYRTHPDNIKVAVLNTIKPIIEKYPQGTKFDFVGLSTGHFVSIYTIMEMNLDQYVGKFIGCVGIAHGLDEFILGVEGFSSMFSDIVDVFTGDTINTIKPYMNPFLQAFYSKYAARINALDKCSVFSPDDGFVVPFDSGKFENGKNISIPGMRHLEGVSKPILFEATKQYCLDNGYWKN